jgi:hypothetical protein
MSQRPKSEKMERKLKWQKYVDPFGDNLDDVTGPGAFGEQYTKEQEEDIHENFGSDVAEGVIDPAGKIANTRPTKMIMTPVGIIALDEHNCPSKAFNLWVGHTNFTITRQMIESMEKIEGVEIIKVFSRYRFILGVGLLFQATPVLMAVQTDLGVKRAPSVSDIQDEETRSLVDGTKKKIGDKKYWSILVLPNGHIESCHSNDLSEQFKQLHVKYQETYSRVGGHFFTNYDNA